MTSLCTKASQTFSGTFGTFSRTSLNLTRCLHQCTPELFWAEDPISLRCWGKTLGFQHFILRMKEKRCRQLQGGESADSFVFPWATSSLCNLFAEVPLLLLWPASALSYLFVSLSLSVSPSLSATSSLSDLFCSVCNSIPLCPL